MKALRRFRWFAGLALLASAPLFAATQTVTVAPNGSLSFSPSTVTIDAGDSVTFTYKGGGMDHNVVADDDSFTSGNPTNNAFSFTHTFNTAGTFGYYCAIHGGPGGFSMAGKVIVNAVVDTGQHIVGGLSGNWFNPQANQGGHGFQFEVLPNDNMLAIWFVFNPAGTAQSWIYSQGSYDPSSSDVVLPAFLESGGAFPPNFNSSNVSAPTWGTLEFKFTDCNNGTATYTPNTNASNAGYGSVSFPIQRLTSIAGASCP